jgi:Nucleotidyltransferase of unknown function (DUF6036)
MYAWNKLAFGAEELVRFLTEIDRHLSEPMSVVVIGGAAALLQHGAMRPTTDIDIFSTVTSEFAEAIRAARTATGIAIEIEYASIAQPPYNYEDRLERLREPPLAKLEILVPERHDLALMKMARAEEKDLKVLTQLHTNKPFILDTFVDRYLDEMGHVAGNQDIHRIKFLFSMETLFGVAAREHARVRLELGAAEKIVAGTYPMRNTALLEKLGIESETAKNPRFFDSIQQRYDGALLFPYRNREGIVVAAEILSSAGTTLEGFPKTGLWLSRPFEGESKLVVSDSPVEAMAHRQGVRSDSLCYACVPRDCGKEHVAMLKAAVQALGEPREVAIAITDPKVASLVEKALKSHGVKVELPENARSWLDLAQQRMRRVERSMER